MELEPFVSSLDQVPEAFRGCYKEGEDGKFYLQVKASGGYALEDVGTLKSTLAKLKRDTTEQKKKLETFKDLDPDDVRSQLDELETLKTNAGKPNEQHQAQIKQLEEKHQRELKQRDDKAAAEVTERSKLEQALHKELIVGSATKALADCGANVDLLLPHVVQRMKVEKTDDGGYGVIILDEDGVNTKITSAPGSMAPMKVGEFVDSLKKVEKYQPAFVGAGKSGGGSNGGGKNGNSGPNPWKAGSENLTEQMRIARQDPELAKRLMAEAGVAA